MDIFLIETVMKTSAVLKSSQKLVLVALAFSRSSRVYLERAVTKGALRNSYNLEGFIGVLNSESEAAFAATLKNIANLTGYSMRQTRNILSELCARGLVKRAGKIYSINDNNWLGNRRGIDYTVPVAMAGDEPAQGGTDGVDDVEAYL